jgi:hypothetical protein
VKRQQRARQAEAAVDRHILEHGFLCPGEGIPEHPSFDLYGVRHPSDPAIAVRCSGCAHRLTGRHVERVPDPDLAYRDAAAPRTRRTRW